MALGRIGGGVLKDNLERNGSNLSFKNTSGSTALLYLDVVNSRVGINNESPASGYSLDLPTPLYTVGLNSDNTNIQNWTIDSNRLYLNSGDINLSGANSVFLSGLQTDNLTVNFNTFRSNQSNETIRLEPSGTGTVEIYSDWNSDGNIHATGDITFGGDLVLGDDDTDSIVFNSDLNSDLLPDVNDVSELGTFSKRWNNIHVTSLNSASLNTGGLQIDTNVVQTYASDLDLNLRHNDAGYKVALDSILLDSNAISTTSADITISTSAEIEISSTGSLQLPTGGNAVRPTTEGTLRFNNYWNLFEGRSNSGYTPFGGVYSDDGLTNVTAHPSNNILNFQAGSTASGSVDASGINLTSLQVDDINFDTSTITTTTTDTNVNFTPNGTGDIVIDLIKFKQGNITNTTNGGLEFIPTGQGYFKSGITGGMVIPFGSEASRWPSPTIGDTRWNTDSNTLYTCNVTQYILSAGQGGTVSPEYMNELALQYTIILG